MKNLNHSKFRDKCQRFMRAKHIKKLIKFTDLDGKQKRGHKKLYIDRDTYFILLKLKLGRELKLISEGQGIFFRSKSQGSFFPDKINRTGVPINPNVFLILLTKYRL